MSQLKCITIFELLDEDSTNFDWVCAWLGKWAGQLTVADCSSGGWEQLWDVEVPQEAVSEVPEDYFALALGLRLSYLRGQVFGKKLKCFLN